VFSRRLSVEPDFGLRFHKLILCTQRPGLFELLL